MNSINFPQSSSIQTRTATATATAEKSNSIQKIPATSFKHYRVNPDGDCLFKALIMAQNKSLSREPGSQDIMGLRKAAVRYVDRHLDILVNHPSFEGETGVFKLRALLAEKGRWNEDGGDLVAPILAQVLGRELRILQPVDNGLYYEFNTNYTYSPKNDYLPSSADLTEQAPIYLAYINKNHYDYLEPRSDSPLVDADYTGASSPSSATDLPPPASSRTDFPPPASGRTDSPPSEEAPPPRRKKYTTERIGRWWM